MSKIPEWIELIEMQAALLNWYSLCLRPHWVAQMLEQESFREGPSSKVCFQPVSRPGWIALAFLSHTAMARMTRTGAAVGLKPGPWKFRLKSFYMQQICKLMQMELNQFVAIEHSLCNLSKKSYLVTVSESIHSVFGVNHYRIGIVQIKRMNCDTDPQTHHPLNEICSLIHLCAAPFSSEWKVHVAPLEASTPKGRKRPLHVLFWKFPKVKNDILEDQDSTMP